MESEDSDSEGEIQALMGQLERAASKRKKKHKNKEQMPSKVLDSHSTLQAPPSYLERTSSVRSPHLLSGCSFCPEVWGLVCTELSLAYPVLQDPQSKRV